MEKSISPGGKHLQVIKELADVIVRPLWTTMSPGRDDQEHRKANVTLQKKGDLGKYMTVSHTLIQGRWWCNKFQKLFPRHVTDKVVTRSSQQGFTQGKQRLINSITFYNEIYSLVDDRGATDIVHFGLIKALTVPSIISPRQGEEVWVGCTDGEVDWRLAEHWGDQWHEGKVEPSDYQGTPEPVLVQSCSTSSFVANDGAKDKFGDDR